MTRGARVAGVVLVALAVVAVAAPLLEHVVGVRHDVPNLADRGCPRAWPHLLGCDDVGQDVLLRLAFGARVSLAVGLGAAVLSSALGALVGVLAGFVGGRVDAVVMRLVDTMLAIPVLPLLLLSSAMAIGRGPTSADSSTTKLVLLLALFGWMGIARVARAETLRVVTLDFVTASRALGASPIHIVWSHVLPNALAPVMVAATIDVGRNILTESALSFLGLGVQPPTPSWGNMLRHAEDAIYSDPALAFWPGCCILVTVVCVTVLGEAWGRAMDPRTTGTRAPS